MKEQLLDLLREPETGAELELVVSETHNGEIWTGSLRSPVTGREYPIRGGIPRFVPTEGYADSFGLQWNRFSQVQLDSASGATYSRQRFDREVGWSRAQLDGEWVLEVGCGCGRFAEVAAERGANVIALEYSTAVDAAATNLYRYRNVHCVQGDLFHPPLRGRSLNFAYCIGVLQHTPDPQQALASLLTVLAPGGQFACTAYARRWYTRLYSKYWLRPLTRRMPPSLLLRAIERSMPLFFPLTSAAYSIPAIGKLAQFLIPVANYVDKTEFTREQRYQEAVLDTFDMLSPAYDSPMTVDEVAGVLKLMGVEQFQFRSSVPINVIGSTPSGRDARTSSLA